MRSWLEWFGQSAIDVVLQAFWVAVFGIIVGAVVTLWGAFAGLSAPVLDRVIWAVSGMIAVLLVGAAIVGVRKGRLLTEERRRQLSFMSQEKGFLDLMVDQQSAADNLLKQFTLLDADVRRLATGVFRKGTSKLSALQGQATPPITLKRRQVASRMATQLHKSCARIEGRVTATEPLIQLFHESQIGLLTQEIQTGRARRDDLLALRTVSEKLLGMIVAGISQQEIFRDAVQVNWGVSQELNGALSRLMATLDSSIALMRSLEAIYRETVRMANEAIGPSPAG